MNSEADRIADRLPVARVAVDLPLAHLDHDFDYLVPAGMAAAAVAGARVRVRFAGRPVAGYLLERRDASEHPGTLSRLERVVSAEPVLAPQIARLARTVATHYAGTRADVLRLAVPPRHGRAEAEPVSPDPEPEAHPGWRPGTGDWDRYPRGPELLDGLRRGRALRAVWTALPGRRWTAQLAEAAGAARTGGRGALLIVAGAAQAEQLAGALAPLHPTVLAAGLGAEERYRRFLAVSRGRSRLVIGTRAAALAPVAGLGLLAIWDDGDDAHREPHAPYFHARDVLALRAAQEGCALLIGGQSMTVEGSALVARGWAREVTPAREQVRSLAPRARAVHGTPGQDPVEHLGRIPAVALRTLRDGLAHGPVLVQVPRSGYQLAFGCATCRLPARCPACAGTLGRAGREEPVRCPDCAWQAAPATGWRCPGCDGERLRQLVAGVRRTAEELGQAFPAARVRVSGAPRVLRSVADRPALVVATLGAEPVPDAGPGYRAVVLLDGWAVLGRPDLRAAEEALRRWLNAAALAAAAAPLTVLADAAVPAVQALIRWDPAGFAGREAAERAALHFPPATRMAALEGSAQAVAELLALAELPAGADVLGPLPLPGGPDERVLVRVPRAAGGVLATALAHAQGRRSAQRRGGGVRVRLDPAV